MPQAPNIRRNLELASYKWKDKKSYSWLMKHYDLGYTTVYELSQRYKGYFVPEKKGKKEVK